MEGTLRDEELFVQTQLAEDEGERDNVYLELAKAITERKCRIVQKREKIKLMINEAIVKNGKLKSLLNEEKCLKKDIEEVSRQKSLRVENIENAQKSRATLETSLCGLNNKVSVDKAETKRKKDEYDAAIKDAHETWESYKEKYENFPLAKKLQGVAIEVKKVEIAVKQAEINIAEFKKKKKLKRDIAERRFHVRVVQLAEKYKLYQVKVREHQEKLMKMKQHMDDIKSGKAKHQLESSQGSAWTASRKEQHLVCRQPELFMFTVSGIQVTSPPPPANESESSGRRKLFDWGNLLGSSGLLLSGVSKKPEEKSVKPLPMTSVSKPTMASTVVPSSRDESLKERTPYNVKNVGSSMKLTNLLKNISVPQRKPQINIGNKRGNQNEAISEANKQERPPCKKLLVVTPQNTKSSDADPPQSNNVAVYETPLQAVIRKDEAKDNSFDKNKKDNTNPRTFNSSSDVKYRLQGTPISKAMSQNLMNIMSMQGTGKENKVSESPRKNDQGQAKTIQNESKNRQQISQHNRQRNYNEEDFFQNANSDRQNQPFESSQIMLEPGSPAPDLIPVETNTQSSSQGNIVPTCSPIEFNLSGGSDFISPDVDEASKISEIYQRMVSQGPYPAQEYSRKNVMNTQKPTSEEYVVRSQYFTDPHRLNTPPDGQGGDYQSPIEQPFSPPLLSGEFDNNQLGIPSPPPANTGAFGGGNDPAPNTSAFNFMGSSVNVSKKSFFDLF